MQLTKPTLIDPLYPISDEVFQNPYPYYKTLRETKPVYRSPERNWWLLTRYEDVVKAFRDPALSTRYEPRLFKMMSKIPASMQCPFAGLLDRLGVQDSKGHWMPGKNPPVHTQIKKLLNAFFSPARLQQLVPNVEQMCHQMIDKHYHSRSMDIISDYAFPIPFAVITQMIDVPTDDLVQVESWCREIFPLFGLYTPPEESQKANRAIEVFTSYLMPIVESRRKRPGTDLISGLLVAGEDGFKLTNRQVAANVVLMTFAGFETTEATIGNGLLALLRHPEQFELLKSNLTLIDSAVEEIFRYDPAVQFETRTVAQPIEIGGELIRPGETVHAFQGAANRDPEVFANPETFDITREKNKHLAFGVGIHYCIGAPLARLEAQIALRIIAERLPEIRLRDKEVRFKPHLRPRALYSLPVTF